MSVGVLFVRWLDATKRAYRTNPDPNRSPVFLRPSAKTAVEWASHPTSNFVDASSALTSMPMAVTRFAKLRFSRWCSLTCELSPPAAMVAPRLDRTKGNRLDLEVRLRSGRSLDHLNLGNRRLDGSIL